MTCCGFVSPDLLSVILTILGAPTSRRRYEVAIERRQRTPLRSTFRGVESHRSLRLLPDGAPSEGVLSLLLLSTGTPARNVLTGRGCGTVLVPLKVVPL